MQTCFPTFGSRAGLYGRAKEESMSKKLIAAHRILFILAFAILFLASCSSPSTGVTSVSSALTVTNTPTHPTTTPAQPVSTATEFIPPWFTPIPPTPTEVQLPFNDKNVESEYCRQWPPILLSIADAQGLSEDEIAGKLVGLFLAYFNAPQAPDYCRIDGYRIDKIYYDERYAYLPLVPKGDFMRAVLFSIKLIQIPNVWMAWAGPIDEQNWFHTGANVAVFRSDNGYTMQFAYP
jgi:hypothetical protein